MKRTLWQIAQQTQAVHFAGEFGVGDADFEDALTPGPSPKEHGRGEQGGGTNIVVGKAREGRAQLEVPARGGLGEETRRAGDPRVGLVASESANQVL